MNAYIIALELFLYAFGAFILLKKGDFAILYLPVIFFCDTVTDNHYITAFAYYAMVSVIIIKAIADNPDFLKYNIFAGLIITYFFVLMTRATNLDAERANVFNVIWFFALMPLIVSIYKKHSKDVLLKELFYCSSIVLCLFIVSVLVSSYFHFNPYEMYGITGGMLFGNLYATDFNIIGPAIFVNLYWALNNRKYFLAIIGVVSLAFIALSMRRSVMGISAIGVCVVTLIYLSKNIRQILPFMAASVVIVFIVVFKTDFTASLNERYELRNLDERAVNEEQRYFEYKLLYDDVFHYHRYSPWIGFELFNSPGNYGGGKFYDRSLHGDITNIGHSSGFIGLALYFLMIITAFRAAWKESRNLHEKMIIGFCCITFTSYCLTGRYTQVGCMMMIFLVANLARACPQEVAEELAEEVSEEDSKYPVLVSSPVPVA